MYTVCVCPGVWSTENVRWGGLDVVFQSEWPAEENNKARMTGTDGPLYCPLKCKHWISLLGGWHYYIFIFSLLSLSLLIALVAGTHPHLRLKGLIKGWSQMLIIGCLRFNGQWHRTKMTRVAQLSKQLDKSAVQRGHPHAKSVLKATSQHLYTTALSEITA